LSAHHCLADQAFNLSADHACGQIFYNDGSFWLKNRSHDTFRTTTPKTPSGSVLQPGAMIRLENGVTVTFGPRGYTASLAVSS
jgi:predicted component of type VI protein secretion system